ncbi:BQ2448_3966 [Microbotryum intermedium]|uniref:BQ2448_3966 protein n=1 Tax=Microbotryum intermedium TaxID=269621 RepID=A0A238FI02_9BASI|nr:BQ2448_3966 [Microbotryum intermedium]
MARNEEKSQSMLYRFREAQAAELGLATKTDRRPRVAASCKDLKQCERWRGEILRVISRKVSKIQDSGLTDYEVRDLNDEINKLLREKHHWENQIVALGGANYKRVGLAGRMKDADGKDVPGTRGYKYFGRAKDLPGVRDMFASRCMLPIRAYGSQRDRSLIYDSFIAATEEAELDSHKKQRINLFANPAPGYYGDEDEIDASLLESERTAEAEAWEDALENLRDLGLVIPEGDDAPPLPTAKYISLNPPTSTNTTEATEAEPAEAEATTGAKRKAATTTKGMGKSKKAKLDEEAVEEAPNKEVDVGPTNGFLSILKAEDLRPPQLLSAKDIEKLIVEQQKKKLLAEYLDKDK